jgi:hypothetical protein
LSIYDLRTRNINYTAPEYIDMYEELTDIIMDPFNGEIIEDSFEIQEFLLKKRY